MASRYARPPSVFPRRQKSTPPPAGAHHLQCGWAGPVRPPGQVNLFCFFSAFMRLALFLELGLDPACVLATYAVSLLSDAS